jgi:hypothetical protein
MAGASKRAFCFHLNARGHIEAPLFGMVLKNLFKKICESR